MARQEEIRERVARFLYEARGGKNWEKSTNREEWLNHADELLAHLDSQGVVLKVERKLPIIFPDVAHTQGLPELRRTFLYHLTRGEKLYSEQAYNLGQNDMLKAGYVAVEPLIKE